MFRKFIALVVSLSIGLGAVGSATADVSNNMNAYWSSGLTSANVTGPRVYQTQAGGYYSLGNLSYRTPQETTQVATLTLPSISGGCGGIDMYAGAFSFIGADQLIAAIKGIASNAAPYAFMLALQLISSPIADQLKTFQDWANKMNQFNIGSCEAAQKAVDWTAHQVIGDAFCQRLGRTKGTFSDAAAARGGCGAKTNATLANTSTEEAKFQPVNRNLAWEAIKNNGLISSDLELGQVMMTLTGTYIITCPNDATGVQGCNQLILPPQGDKDSIMTLLLDGGQMKAMKCDDTRCLNPLKDGLTVNIPTTLCTSYASSCSLKNKVAYALTNIVTKIRTRQALSAEETSFLGMTSLPVYRMASVYASQPGVSADMAMAEYSEVIALDLAYGWLAKNVQAVQEGARSTTGIDPNQLKIWWDNTNQLMQAISDKKQLSATKLNTIISIVRNTQIADETIKNAQRSQIAESLRFTAGLNR